MTVRNGVNSLSRSIGNSFQEIGMQMRSSREWVEVFEANSEERDFGVERGVVTEDQRAAVFSSVQEFQLGETGEGSHLMRRAKEHAAETGDQEYPTALRLFIAEEMRHARELKVFMDAQGIPV